MEHRMISEEECSCGCSGPNPCCQKDCPHCNVPGGNYIEPLKIDTCEKCKQAGFTCDFIEEEDGGPRCSILS